MKSEQGVIDKEFIVSCLTKQVAWSISCDCGGLYLLRTGLVLDVDIKEVFDVGYASFLVASRLSRPVGYVLNPKRGDVAYGGFYVLITDKSDTHEGITNLYEDESIIVSRFDMSVLMSSKKQIVKSNAPE